MKIIKAHLNQQTCNFLQNLHELTLFDMLQDDIDNDPNLRNQEIEVEDGENIMVFQGIGNPHGIIEKYFYIVYRSLVGGDGLTTVTVIDKILIDYNAINVEVLTLAFKILFQQDYGMYDRIWVGRINERITFQINQLPTTIAQYLVKACNNNQGRNPIILN